MPLVHLEAAVKYISNCPDVAPIDWGVGIERLAGEGEEISCFCDCVRDSEGK
jgi:hypothetical protein